MIRWTDNYGLSRRFGPLFARSSPTARSTCSRMRPHRTRAASNWLQSPKQVVTSMVTSLYLKLRSLFNREEGQGMVEYALILVLIAVVVIVVLIILGNQVKNVFCNISGGLGQ